MLVSELKKQIENYEKKDLEKIIIELYKRIPKNKKEDYNIDYFIQNVNVSVKTEKKEIDFDDLRSEINYFLECVDDGLYGSPNKIISKKERSSYRFKVKRYYKELLNILPLTSKGEVATILLIELYKRLSIGSNTLLFTNWDTFRALGEPQRIYYCKIIERILKEGYTDINIQKCIDLLDIPSDPNELSYDRFDILIKFLKNDEDKRLAIELINKKLDTLKEKLQNAKDYSKRYDIEQEIENFVLCATNIYFKLNDVPTGIKYYQKNYIENDKEIKEYVLLNELKYNGLYKEWLEEYESKIGKIKFRESLVKDYYKLKEILKEEVEE